MATFESLVTAALLLPIAAAAACGADFRVTPYLQNPASDAITIRWLSDAADPGSLSINGQTFTSSPTLAATLDYQAAEPAGDRYAGLPWLHSVRVTGLPAATAYPYAVSQGGSTAGGTVATPIPSATTSGLATGSGVRLFVYSDPETEPESAAARVGWAAPPGANRPAWVGGLYPATQTVGYTQNLAIVAARAAAAQAAGRATLIALPGDLVESGGEQRDWDEFWRHSAGPYGSVAASAALVPGLGNHENYGGPGALGGYSPAAATAGVAKFQTYFDLPDNGAVFADHTGRYHRVDFGPVTLLTIDSSNGGSDNTTTDTNFFLDTAANPQIPDYMPGSSQYQWLLGQLQSAQAAGQITFVQYHHAAYSVGPHGYPAGTGTGFDTQSGQPLRVLTPLLALYDVAAVFSGHDEMYEHSFVDGIHFYDVGASGDGLRGPQSDLTNPFQTFLAHADAPEVWAGDELVSGGKHYGHLEIDVTLAASGRWDVSITPAYAFPLLSPTNPGEILGWERRTYADVVTFSAVPEPNALLLAAALTAVAFGAGRRWQACGDRPVESGCEAGLGRTAVDELLAEAPEEAGDPLRAGLRVFERGNLRSLFAVQTADRVAEVVFVRATR